MFKLELPGRQQERHVAHNRSMPCFAETSYLNLNAAQQVVYCEGTLLVAYSW